MWRRWRAAPDDDLEQLWRNLGLDVNDTLLRHPAGSPVYPSSASSLTSLQRGERSDDRDLYKRYWGDAKVTRIYVRTEPGVDRNTVRAEIGRRLGRAHNLRVLSSAELVDYFVGQVRKAFAGIYTLAVVVLIIIVAGMADTLAAGVVDRIRMLGTLRAIGVRRDRLRQMVVVEAALLGVLGLVLASISGAALGALWVEGTFPSLLGWVSVTFPAGPSPASAAITLAACHRLCCLPARRADRAGGDTLE
jgi:putative ABC transport system permease protein